MAPLLRWLRRTGLHRGLAGEGWPWLALAASAFLWERARRERVETVARIKVQAGDRFVIRAVDRRRRPRHGRGGGKDGVPA